MRCWIGLTLAACCIAQVVHADIYRDASRGDVAAVRADLQANPKLLDAHDRAHRATALHWAAFGKSDEVVALLLEQGALVDPLNDVGMTPLHNAAWEGDLQTVSRLLLAGANPCRKDNTGTLPRQYAEAQGHGDVASALTRAEADFADIAGRLKVLIAVGKYPEARAAAKRWTDSGCPGDSPEVRKGLDHDLYSIAVKVKCQMFVLDERSFPKDIQANYRKEGGWDFPIPVETAHLKVAVLLANVRSHTERTDSAGNHWWRLTPQDMDRPVVIKMITKFIPGFIDPAQLDGDYEVPAKYHKYLESSDEINSGSALAREIAAPLKAQTRKQTLLNVEKWIDDNLHYGKVEGFGNDSESSLRTKWTVCFGYATSTCALLRANGLAARVVRGVGHSWPQVWVPRDGWMDIQDHVEPLGRTDWNVTPYVAEPLDNTTYSVLLDWHFCNLFWAAQFEDFFIWGPTRFMPVKELAKSMEDVSLDEALRQSGEADVIMGKDVRLDDLPTWSEQQGWGKLARGTSVENHRIRIGGVPYTAGLGTHSHSNLMYALGGCYKRFEAKVGVDDETPGGSVQFRVFTDDKLAFDSGVMHNGDRAKEVNIPLGSAVCIRLEVTDGGDGSQNDHADWADARLIGNAPPFRFVCLSADSQTTK